MFCPTCGSEERQASQFCRACGVDLRAVRMSIERPDSITASAASARDEIGRAVAERIRTVDGKDLSAVAEEVLPELEKFLESPDEKRLRRLRAGVVMALMGLGAGVPALALTAAMTKVDELFFLYVILGLGSITFAIGLALVINGLLFTRPRKELEDHSADARLQEVLDATMRPQCGWCRRPLPLHAQTPQTCKRPCS